MAQHKEFIKGAFSQRRQLKKLKQRHTGPYEVLEQVSDQTYRLDVKADFPRLHPVFHAALLWKDVVRGPGEELLTYKEATRNKEFNPSQR